MSGVPHLIFSVRAAEHLRAVIDEDAQGARLRISVLDDAEETRFGFSLDYDSAEGDTVVDLGLIEVILDPASAAALDGSEVDYIADDEGERFIIRDQLRQF